MQVRSASLCVTQIIPFWYDVALPKATGFFYRYGQSIGLITNWHVLAGRHPTTLIPFNGDGLCPTRLECHMTLHDKTKDILSFDVLKLSLIAEGGATVWWQHPGYRNDVGLMQHVDLGVVPLDKLPHFDVWQGQICTFSPQVLVSVDESGEPKGVEHAYAQAGAEVFILGFPLGLASQGVLPIWKRGSIASEPLVPIEGNLPIFFVDAATRHGMSGSPIFYLGDELTDRQGAPAGIARRKGDPWLLGVYAGRRGSTDNELDMTLGRGWHRHLLDEIFMRQIPGGTSLVSNTNTTQSG